MDKQIGSLLNKFREAVQNNEGNRRHYGDDGNELRVVEASRVFISRINPNLTSQNVLDYFEVLKFLSHLCLAGILYQLDLYLKSFGVGGKTKFGL